MFWVKNSWQNSTLSMTLLCKIVYLSSVCVWRVHKTFKVIQNIGRLKMIFKKKLFCFMVFCIL